MANPLQRISSDFKKSVEDVQNGIQKGVSDVVSLGRTSSAGSDPSPSTSDIAAPVPVVTSPGLVTAEERPALTSRISSFVEGSLKFPRELQLPKMASFNGGDSANPHAPSTPPYGFPPKLKMPDIRLPRLGTLTDSNAPLKERSFNFWGEISEFLERLSWFFFLPLSWFLTFQHAALSIAWQGFTFPIWFTFEVYERKIRVRYPWLPSIWGIIFALLPKGIPFPNLSALSTDAFQKFQGAIPDLPVDLGAIRNGGAEKIAELQSTLKGVADSPVEGLKGGIKGIQNQTNRVGDMLKSVTNGAGS